MDIFEINLGVRANADIALKKVFFFFNLYLKIFWKIEKKNLSEHLICESESVLTYVLNQLHNLG